MIWLGYTEKEHHAPQEGDDAETMPQQGEATNPMAKVVVLLSDAVPSWLKSKGTNLMRMTGVAGAGWYKLHKKRMVHYTIGFMIGFPTAVGAILGANLVFHIFSH